MHDLSISYCSLAAVLLKLYRPTPPETIYRYHSHGFYCQTTWLVSNNNWEGTGLRMGQSISWLLFFFGELILKVLKLNILNMSLYCTLCSLENVGARCHTLCCSRCWSGPTLRLLVSISILELSCRRYPLWSNPRRFRSLFAFFEEEFMKQTWPLFPI